MLAHIFLKRTYFYAFYSVANSNFQISVYKKFPFCQFWSSEVLFRNFPTTDFAWNQFFINWGSPKWQFYCLKILTFGTFQPRDIGKFQQKSKFKASKIVKMAAFDIFLSLKLISRKIQATEKILKISTLYFFLKHFIIDHECWQHWF